MAHSLEQLQAFLIAAEGGSFSEAARRLNKAQSTVSTLVSNLEIEVGAELFDRSSRSPTLTPEGRALLREARGVVQALELFERRCDSLCAEVEDTLTIAIDESVIAREALTRVLREFGERFALTRIVMLDTGLDGPSELVRSGVADLGLMTTLEDYPEEIQFRGVGRSESITVAGKDHPLAAFDSVTPSDLAFHRHLRITSQWAGARAEDSEPSNEVWLADSYRSLIALVRDGFGWADVPPDMIADDLENRSVVRLNTLHQRVPYTTPVDLVWSTSARPGKAMEWLIEALSSINQKACFETGK